MSRRSICHTCCYGDKCRGGGGKGCDYYSPLDDMTHDLDLTRKLSDEDYWDYREEWRQYVSDYSDGNQE